MAKNTCDTTKSNASRNACIARDNLDPNDEVYAFVRSVDFIDVDPSTKKVTVSIVRLNEVPYRTAFTWSTDTQEIWFGCPCVIDSDDSADKLPSTTVGSLVAGAIGESLQGQEPRPSAGGNPGTAEASAQASVPSPIAW